MKRVFVRILEPPPNPCPRCSNNLNCHAVGEGPDAIPEPEDITICCHCHTVLIFNEDMRLELAPPHVIAGQAEGINKCYDKMKGLHR